MIRRRSSPGPAAIALRLTICTAAALLPLTFYLNAYEVFELSKSLVLKICAVSAALLVVVRGVPLKSRSVVGALILLTAAAPSLLTTPLREATIERYWEIVSLAFLLIAAEAGGVSVGRLLGVAITSHLLVTLYGAFQYLGLDQYLGPLHINWTTFGPKRVYSTMGNPDFLAAQTSLILPVLCGLYFGLRRESLRAMLLLCVILAVPSLIYTQGRGAYVGFIASYVAFRVLMYAHEFRGDVVPLARRLARHLRFDFLAGVLLTGLMLMHPTGRAFIERFTELLEPVKASSLQIRLFYWYSGWLMGTRTSLAGGGLGAFHLAGAKTQGQAQMIWNEKWPRAAEVVSPHLELYAHNDYVHLFAEIGPIGLGVYLWIMVTLLLSGYAALRALPREAALDRWLLIGLLASSVSFYVNSVSNFPLKVVATAHLFFCVVAAGLLRYTALPLWTILIPREGTARTFMIVVGIAAAAGLGERGCAKLMASHMLKAGHRLLQESQAKAQQAKPRESSAYLEAALRRFDQADRLRPYHTDAILVHYYAGKAHQNAGRLSEAINAYTRALQTFVYFPEGFQARGMARLTRAIESPDRTTGTPHLRRAIDDLERAAGLNPKDHMTLFYLGTARRLAGELGASAEALLDSLRYSESALPEVAFNLALVRVQQGRLDDARRVLESILVRSPGYGPATFALSQLRAGRLPDSSLGPF